MKLTFNLVNDDGSVARSWDMTTMDAAYGLKTQVLNELHDATNGGAEILRGYILTEGARDEDIDDVIGEVNMPLSSAMTVTQIEGQLIPLVEVHDGEV